MVLPQSLYRHCGVVLIFLHVLVPGISEFGKLFALNLLNKNKFLVLLVFHIAHLTSILHLCKQTQLLSAATGFFVVEFSMTLVKVVVQQSTF